MATERQTETRTVARNTVPKARHGKRKHISTFALDSRHNTEYIGKQYFECKTGRTPIKHLLNNRGKNTIQGQLAPFRFYQDMCPCLFNLPDRYNDKVCPFHSNGKWFSKFWNVSHSGPDASSAMISFLKSGLYTFSFYDIIKRAIFCVLLNFHITQIVKLTLGGNTFS